MTVDRVILKTNLLLHNFNSLFLKDTGFYNYIYFLKRTVINSFVGLQAIYAILLSRVLSLTSVDCW